MRPTFSCSSGCQFVSIMLTLLTCVKSESNPRSGRCDSCCNFSECHWNLNSMTSHNFGKMNLLESLSNINKFDFIYLSKSYLDSAIATENDNLTIEGYKLQKADHPQ